MKDFVRLVLLPLFLFAKIASASFAAENGAAEDAQEAVIQFCLPSLQGSNTAKLALSLGAKLHEKTRPNQLNWIAEAGVGIFYQLPSKNGTVLIQAKSIKRSAVCNVALFDVEPQEGERAFQMLDAFFKARGYRKKGETSDGGVKTFNYKGDNTQIVLSKPQAGANGAQMHVTMKRRAYLF